MATSNQIFFKQILSGAIITFALLFSSFIVVSALNPFDISYPISELGNCGSQEECRIFCDNPDNKISCLNWAESKNFVSPEKAKKSRNLIEFEKSPEKYGPGGCITPQECDVFCRVRENLNECLKFNVEQGFMPQEEADKIIAKADKKGPGGCDSKESCDNFCRNPENMKECMQFAVNEGKITQEEADFMAQNAQVRGPRGPKGPAGGGPKPPKIDEEKAKTALELKGGGPGGCKNMEECGVYCNGPEHGEECLNFAVENGFMPQEEVERVKKMMTMTGPGGCKGPQECDEFCGKEENRDTCFNFTKENGLMPPEEIERMEKEMQIVRKLGTEAGPGGCRSPKECDAYCRNPENMNECMDFGAKHGMMSKENADRMMQEKHNIEKRMDRLEIFRNPQGPQGPQPGEQFMAPPEGMRKMPYGSEGFQPPQDMQNMFPKEGEGWKPPEGNFMAPPEGMQMPEGMQPREGEQFMMPPEGYQPPEGYYYQKPSEEGMPPQQFQEFNQPPEGSQFPPPPSSDGIIPPSLPPSDNTQPILPSGAINPIPFLGLISNLFNLIR